MKELLSNTPFLELSIILVIVTFATMTDYALKFTKLSELLAKKFSIKSDEAYIYISRTATFFITGLIPAVLVFFIAGKGLGSFGVTLPVGRWYWWLLGGLVMNGTMLVGRYFTPKIHALYPEFKVKQWTPARFTANGIVWILYLIGYEFLFRGVLFFTLLNALGLVPALLISSCIYGLVHLGRSMEEAFNSTYFHLMLCLSVYFTQSILVAFIVHVFIAVFNDYLSIKKDPSSVFVKNRDLN